MVQLIGKRLIAALSTVPTAANWLQLGLPLIGLAILSLLIGFKQELRS